MDRRNGGHLSVGIQPVEAGYDSRMDAPIDQIIRRRPGWDEAMARLQTRLASHGAAAQVAARDYGHRYEGRRAAMIVDVVGSRQRRYATRVQSMVDRFDSDHPRASLNDLATDPGAPVTGLRAGEADTMRQVAEGLLRFGSDAGITGDEQIVKAWAAATEGLEIAHSLDPYVGDVKGVGTALFAYMRMRSGGDGLKPDVRVRASMSSLGFNPPAGDVALLLLCRAAATELGTSMLVLDQLLWDDRDAGTS